jgi:hypothetical protein
MTTTLIEPTLLLDKQKCLRNINTIVEKAKGNRVQLRPHFKTHQSHEIGRWFRDAGVTKIAVSSLRMAEYFAEDGWDDITVAFPVNVHEKDRINSLTEKITLNLLVVSAEAISWLANEVKCKVNIFIEVDNGYHRTGVSPTDFNTLDSILSEIKRFSHLHFTGFLSHAGHSYKVNGRDAILSIHKESTEVMLPLKEHYKSIYPNLILSTDDFFASHSGIGAANQILDLAGAMGCQCVGPLGSHNYAGRLRARATESHSLAAVIFDTSPANVGKGSDLVAKIQFLGMHLTSFAQFVGLEHAGLVDCRLHGGFERYR